MREGGVDDEQVVLAAFVKLVQPLHSYVVVALCKAPGDVLVQGVVKDLIGRATVRRMALDESVPGFRHVEHRCPELATWPYAGGGERLVRHPGGGVAETADAECIRQAPGGVDR